MEVDEVLGIQRQAVSPPAIWRNLWDAAYGGYVAAVMVRGLERCTLPRQPIVGAHVAFVRPLRVSLSATLTAEVHRTGRSTCSVSGQLVQNGAVAALGTGWARAPGDGPTRVDVVCPEVAEPEDYELAQRDPESGAFVGVDLDLRPVPTPADTTLALQWMRLARIAVGQTSPWPVPALALAADLVGMGQYRAVQLAMGDGFGTIAVDLTLHVVADAQSAWLLGAYENVALGSDRTIGRGFLFDERRQLVAKVVQQSLIRRVQ